VIHRKAERAAHTEPFRPVGDDLQSCTDKHGVNLISYALSFDRLLYRFASFHTLSTFPNQTSKRR
jgi:hypothetical protein